MLQNFSPLKFKISELSAIDPELIIMSLIDPLKLLISPFLVMLIRI